MSKFIATLAASAALLTGPFAHSAAPAAAGCPTPACCGKACCDKPCCANGCSCDDCAACCGCCK